MKQIFANETHSKTDIPFAMLFASEPSFEILPQDELLSELNYNPAYQVNDDTRLDTGNQKTVAGRNSTGRTLIESFDND